GPAGREARLDAFLAPVRPAEGRPAVHALPDEKHRRPRVVVLPVAPVQLRAPPELRAVDDRRLIEQRAPADARLRGERGDELVEEPEQLVPAAVLVLVVRVRVEAADRV